MSGGHEPDFSIVVPTRDRPSSLAACLEAIGRLDYPRDRYEVVVVDDGSRALVEPVVAPFRSRVGARVVSGAGKGPAAARNAGAAAARGAMLAFTDDDCAPRPGWLAAIAARAASDPNAGVGGPMVNRLSASLCSTASQMLVDHLVERHNDSAGEGRFFTTSSLALPARGFRELGGFSPRFDRPGGEDRELCDRWIRSGRRIFWEPTAVVDHAHPLTLGSFWNQHLRYGRGARDFHRARIEQGAGRPPFEPPGFYLTLVGRPFRTRSARPLRLAALLALSQLANAVGFVTAPMRGD